MKSNDMYFVDVEIIGVDEAEGGYTLRRSDGWSFFVDKDRCPVAPKVGDSARFYGKGTVRGLELNGTECFYMTAEEMRAKQEKELYGESAADMLSRWDADKNVWSVEMGGLGPGYEQAIQILMMELVRHGLSNGLPDDSNYREWGDSVVSALDDKMGGFSGAQVGAAKNLAYQFLKFGPVEMMNKCSGDRRIQINKDFPRI